MLNVISPDFENDLDTWRRLPLCDLRDLLGLYTDSMSDMCCGSRLLGVLYTKRRVLNCIVKTIGMNGNY